MPRVNPYNTQKDEAPITLSAIKQIVEASSQKVVEQLSNRISVLEDRLNRIEMATTNQQKINSEVQCNMTEIQRSVLTLQQAQESALKHSYSFELLLHGIPEDETPDIELLSTFLREKNLTEFLPAIEGTAFRLGKVRTQQQGSRMGPRPILFRLLSRTARIPLLHAASKKTVPPGTPYLSAHLTHHQLVELREKAQKKSTTISGQEQPSMDQ